MTDLMTTLYPWAKVLHIAAVISWMAGMFYLPRLFVYHAEKAEVGSHMDMTFQIMEEKLIRVIMTPAMIVTWLAGLWLAFTPGVFDWGSVWAWTKILSVLGMSGCHGWLSKRRKEFAAGQNSRSGRTFRIVNEIPTLLMLVILIAIVVRPF